MEISVARLRELIAAALRTYGYPDDEVDLICDVLVYAQLRDSSQGIVKLIVPGLPRSPEAGEIAVVRETRSSVLLNGNHSSGMVVMASAVDLAIAKARETGFGIVGTFGTSDSTGAIGYYVRRIAAAGLIGIAFSGSPRAVSPYGSFEPLLGTNPLAIGLPSGSTPFVLDMATSAMSWYDLVTAASRGESIPLDAAYDQDGVPTSDPQKAMLGALSTFDRGAKGSGLSMMIEALTGPLVGGAFAGMGDESDNWGNLVMALDPELLVPAKDFRDGVARLAARIRDAKRLPGTSEVLAPGERGDRLTESRLEFDLIDVDENLLKQLEDLGVRGAERS